MINESPLCSCCGKEISTQSKSGMCKSCVQTGGGNHRWNGGKKVCVDCGKSLSKNKYERCMACSGKIKQGVKREPFSEEWLRNMSEASKRVHQNPEVIERISRQSKKRWQGKAFRKKMKAMWTEEKREQYAEKSREVTTALWKQKDYREKVFKGWRKSMKLKPNNVEKVMIDLLQEVFPDEYKYVGDLKFIIGGKNPDFININGQKKIIELFGDYWHSEAVIGKPMKVHEKERIALFGKYGYQTLIVWESELTNIEAVKQKVIVFHNN